MGKQYKSPEVILVNTEAKRFLMYMLRWQMSTPILAVVNIILASMNEWTACIIANFIGSLIFYWVDKYIFK